MFLHPLPRLRQTYPTPTSSNWPLHNNLQKQQGSLLLFEICHPWLRHSYPYDQPLLSRELSKLPTSTRGVGAHSLATGHPLQYNNRRKQQGCLLLLHICRLASPLLPLPPTTFFSRFRHFQRSPGRGAFSPPPRFRNPCMCKNKTRSNAPTETPASPSLITLIASSYQLAFNDLSFSFGRLWGRETQNGTGFTPRSYSFPYPVHTSQI